MKHCDPATLTKKIKPILMHQQKIHFSTDFIPHYVKYVRIWATSSPHFPIEGQNRRFCPYTRKYGSKVNCILAYFTQCHQAP